MYGIDDIRPRSEKEEGLCDILYRSDGLWSLYQEVEKNIAFEKGVTDLKCDLSTRTAIVTYKTDKTSKTRLAAAFKKIGMEAVPVDNGAGCPVPPVKKSEHTHAH